MTDADNVHHLPERRELRRMLSALPAPAEEKAGASSPRAEAPEPQSTPSQEAPVSRTGARRRRWLRPAMFALLPWALIAGAIAYVKGGRIMSTDDAYVNTRQVGISTDVAGIVSEVDVTENQHVAAGQVLYRLDARQFRIALDNAKANLALVALNLESLRKNYGQSRSDAAAQQAQVELDQATYERYDRLLAANAIAQLVYDQAPSRFKRTQASSRRCASRPRRNWRRF